MNGVREMRGIRGATTIKENTKEDVQQAVQELVMEIINRNALHPEDIGAVIFSATEDITAAFPASGVRKIQGMELVPLFDTRQMDVDHALPMCIRVLLLAETEKPQREINHVYLCGAEVLRPDLVNH